QTYTISDAVARETDYLYTVSVSQYIGCNVTSAPQAITVVADPVVTITADDPVICVGGSTTLHVNVENGVSGVNGLGNYTYNWYSTNSPVTSLGTGTSLTVAGTTEQITTYWVEVTSPYGCSVLAYYYNFEVVSDPTVSISIASGYSTEVCEGGQTMLVASVQGGLGTPSYQWYRNGVLLPGETNASIMTTPLYSTQTADYSVNVVMSGVGCDATANFVANNIVVPAPVVTITGNTNTCPGGTVTLTATIIGGVANDNYTYQWYKVSNGVTTAINGATTAVYTTSPLLLGDSYEYYVTISSFASGCSATSGTVLANVVPEPTVSITGANSVCEGGVLTLTALVQGGIPSVGYTYTWTYQQGTNSGSYQTTVPVFQLPTTLPSNDPASPYVFNVSIMSDQFHCDAVSGSHVVNIQAVPSVNITLDHTVVCSGASVIATAHVTPVGTYNYVWTVNGVVQGINAAMLTMNNLPVGDNNISVAVTPNYANAACHASAGAVVTVVADPVVTIASDVTSLCAGGSVNLSVQSITVNNAIAGVYTYEWRVNGVLIPNVIGNTLSQTLNTPGTYVYALRVVMNNGLGCGSDWSNEIVVTVAPQPVVAINPAGLGILDLCVGGDVTLSATVTNSNPGHGTYTYTWYSNNTNTGVSTNPYNQTLNAVGTYNYYVVVNSTGNACAPVASNVVTYHVVADPTWTTISVLYPEICVGETVQLNAAVQGGVQDGSGNTNGVIHWTVWPEGGVAQVVDGGIGGTSFDTPDAAGQYYYQPTYIGQLGSGCDIDVNPITPVVVHERPTAQFVGGDGTVICGNDPNSFATLVVQLTGTAPFTFTLTGSNGYSQMFTTSLNTFHIFLNPLFTGSYSITNLHDANCAAVDYPAPVTIIVSHIDVLDLVVETCGETEDGSLPTVQIDVNIAATSPGMAPIAFITYLTDPAMNTQSPIYYTGSRTYIEFTTPTTPGDYPIIITIDGCDYHALVRVLIGQYNLGGTDALMQQRWDDVVVVNNNPETNGGYTFVTYQWYKDGVEIPGATHQYYQEIGGLNGFYSVKLTAETEDGLVEFKTCEQFFVSQNLTKVYPVPANVEETVTIEVTLTADELEGAVLDIFDAKGALVRQLPVEDVIIRVSGFKTPGAYFGRITTGTNEIKTVKFVIIK
ncbi:MAG TPA: T9SS type A sorting domain-containing protein, partial [Bacteroidales bacterium]|nr:T9SS type A sorting domain-containing protein [Bacteroidales bacterium]